MSVFPLALGILPVDSPKVGHILNLIYDKNELWSPYGVRSLSIQDPFYQQGEDYWRGSIWINVNYLILQVLHNVTCFLF